MKIGDLEKKRVLILGFGREGVDTFKFLRKLFPKKTLAIADKLTFEKLNKKVQKLIHYPSRSEGWRRTNVLRDEKCSRRIKLYLGKNYLQTIKKYDIIIKSPGIPFKILPKSALPKIKTQTEIFFENCPGKIIGITGTKGKGTTASLIYQILKKAGYRVHLIGNIGEPVLQLLFSATPKNIYVYELSSHQLYNLKRSPQIAVLLNIYPDHLDYYKNFKEYANAKANITRYQTKEDYLIYASANKTVNQIAKKSKARKIPISKSYKSDNIAAAIEVAKLFKISKNKIIKAAKDFKPLPHRLEYIGTYRGIKFYNDSSASVPEATIFAINALGDRVQTIFLGGSDKKLSFKNLAKRILKSKIKNLIFFPITGEKIWQEILRISRATHCSNKVRMKAGYSQAFFADNMREAVKLAFQSTQKGKICLLSCGSASFSMFRNYKERGKSFKKYVKKFALL